MVGDMTMHRCGPWTADGIMDFQDAEEGLLIAVGLDPEQCDLWDVLGQVQWAPAGMVDASGADRELRVLEELSGVDRAQVEQLGRDGASSLSLADRVLWLDRALDADDIYMPGAVLDEMTAGQAVVDAAVAAGPGIPLTEGTPESCGPWDAPAGYGPWGRLADDAPEPVPPDTGPVPPVMADPDVAWGAGL